MNRLAAFNDSFERCQEIYYKTFFARFYALFAASSPAVARLFEGSDEQRRYDMLEESILLLVDYSLNQGASEELKQLAQLHCRLGAEAKMFDEWLESLVAALKHVDERFSTEEEHAWRELLNPGVEFMKRWCI